LSKILSDLKIVKQQELKKAQEEKEDNQQVQTTNVRNQKYAKDLDLDVKKVGSSTDGVQIVKYKGAKTIAPLKSFKIVKNFGTYYDPVYKIKLFNESVVLQSNEKGSKVVAVLNGKVVYAKKNAGMLENVVIIQHEGGIHTVYSHLDDIAPTLVVGKWVQKGSVVGRVDENLTFQVTKDSSHIDPKDLFNI
jgi:murein DD-endopeptidase MepM/ murein hydrolase activator NlpD